MTAEVRCKHVGFVSVGQPLRCDYCKKMAEPEKNKLGIPKHNKVFRTTDGRVF